MCWKCGSDIILNTSVQRDSECPVCHADLHSCKNCLFYSPGSHYDCHESVDELVKDKERSNFCDSFKIKTHFSARNGTDSSASKDARKKLDALFSI
ncbi:MAG: hypothetical protein K6G00_09095 [Treponema sp.]|nr:hypothetical protein [Treponema sp.]